MFNRTILTMATTSANLENEHKQKRAANRTKARLATALWLVLLLLILILPMLTYQDPPPGQEGILVNLGLPEQGQGDENAAPAESLEQEEELVEESSSSEPLPAEPQETEVPETEPEPVRDPEVITTEDPEEVRLKKEQEEERKRKQSEAEAKKRAEEEAKRKKAEEEARKKAEAEATKKEIGGLFGSGDGKGETGKPGNQGDPEGDPNAEKLQGISTGSGVVGGGLGDRGVLSSPKLTDKSQKQGTVVIRVCVNEGGDVIEADFTQKGSTLSDNSLVQLAETNARKWKFAKSSISKQCGTITYRFTLQ